MSSFLRRFFSSSSSVLFVIWKWVNYWHWSSLQIRLLTVLGSFYFLIFLIRYGDRQFVCTLPSIIIIWENEWTYNSKNSFNISLLFLWILNFSIVIFFNCCPFHIFFFFSSFVCFVSFPLYNSLNRSSNVNLKKNFVEQYLLSSFLLLALVLFCPMTKMRTHLYETYNLNEEEMSSILFGSVFIFCCWVHLILENFKTSG